MSVLRRTVRTLRAAGGAVSQPPFVPNGHFYSPVNGPADVARGLSTITELPGVDLREPAQLELFGTLLPLFEEAPYRRYRAGAGSGNSMYEAADALVYRAFVRHLKPRRVIEVGAGFSTAMLLDTADQYLPALEVTCIEPYPDRLNSLLLAEDKVKLIAAPVQDVPVEVFTQLEPGDVLFIDSTHVAKAGSDVLWLFLHVLPRLAPGVVVHVHDIFWPFEYPAQWLREGRSWNEDYLVHAFLCHNQAWRIELFSSWLWHRHSEAVPQLLRGQEPGALWLRRV
ncbi:class I SAM-dependent methyltransferase [Actinocrinis puniceicyclus]|uniref:Class I SAM-dependent methyltransferase n=1 Tax=Actinocrinis puniceicyclus TaxID=977794 RepID=A0A8J8BDI7_9ACTN|nr:class I SAM-dependent methyltransferase [Actinocrinis puniceicyclus]MBS2964525.1 class I SAM-dependent methyltransferase [Actinocrinis puniceicyclus]